MYLLYNYILSDKELSSCPYCAIFNGGWWPVALFALLALVPLLLFVLVLLLLLVLAALLLAVVV